MLHVRNVSHSCVLTVDGQYTQILSLIRRNEDGLMQIRRDLRRTERDIVASTPRGERSAADHELMSGAPPAERAGDGAAEKKAARRPEDGDDGDNNGRMKEEVVRVSATGKVPQRKTRRARPKDRGADAEFAFMPRLALSRATEKTENVEKGKGPAAVEAAATAAEGGSMPVAMAGAADATESGASVYDRILQQNGWT
jgi:hypothetical protein